MYCITNTSMFYSSFHPWKNEGIHDSNYAARNPHFKNEKGFISNRHAVLLTSYHHWRVGGPTAKKRLDFWKDNEHKGSFRGRSNSLKQLTTILESNTMLHANREGVFILQLGWAFPYTAQALPLSWWPFHTNPGRGTFFSKYRAQKNLISTSPKINDRLGQGKRDF